VLSQLKRLNALVNKLHGTQMLAVLRSEAENWFRSQNAPCPPMPAQPNNTRWNSVYYMIATVLPLRDFVDRSIARFGADYGLVPISPADWKIYAELLSILKPFKELSIYLEGESYPTVPEFLGRLCQACFVAFYATSARFQQFDLDVVAFKNTLMEDIGRRLWETTNDVSLTGLGLHPLYKALSAPQQGIPQPLFAEQGGKNILTFFFRDLQARCKRAILRELQRLSCSG
jgi:hypothetical protein